MKDMINTAWFEKYRPENFDNYVFINETQKNIVNKWIEQGKTYYPSDYTEEISSKKMDNEDSYEDPLYDEIVEFVVSTGKASASLLQRRFKLGYNRAARCIDLLEERGIVGPSKGDKPRDVLVKFESDGE